MMKKAWPFLFLILVCLPVISALVKPGFYITHDGEFNLVRLMHFDSELRKGQFPVRWSFDLNFRYGSPIFTFFYPLMYYLGSLVHFFGFDFGSSLKILIAGATVGSVLLMYLWLSKRFSILAALVGAVLSIWRLWAPTIPAGPIDFFPPEILAFPNTLMVSVRNSVVPIFQTGVSLLFIFLSLKISWLKKPTLLVTLFIALTFFDFYRFFTKYNTFAPRSYLYPENKISQFLKKEETRFVTSRDPLLPANMWLVDSLNSVNGQDTLHSLYYNQFISLINFADLNRVTDRFVQIKNFDSPLLDFLNVKYILALKWKEGRPDTAGKPNYPLDDPIKFPVVFADGLTAVIERKHPFPPVFSVDRYGLASDIREEQKFLEDSDLSQTVLLHQAPGIQGSLTKAQISRISQKGNDIAFETKSAGNSLIVLSTAFYPGWQYYLDGVKQDPPFRANHAFLAIPVPPAEHTVRLVYLPVSFKLGLALTAVSFIALILFLFSHIIRSNNERRSA